VFVVFVIVGAAVLFVAVLLVLGRGDLLQPEVPEAQERLLPDDGIGPADLEELRFSVVQRGYRMDQVDAVLDRLGRELDRRDRRIADLEARVPGSGPDPLPRRRPAAASDEH
jgi:DivIVA domain-containing protein